MDLFFFFQNKILKKINRGHSVEDSILATKLLKEAYLKVGYHLMPGLPGSNIVLDQLILKLKKNCFW